jgi:hypothetical protein
MSEGVQDLLARDRKRKAGDQTAAEFDLPPQPAEVEAPAPAAAEAEPAAEPRGGGKRDGRLKSRQQRRRDMEAKGESAGRDG